MSDTPYSVICTQPIDYRGTSIPNLAEQLATMVCHWYNCLVFFQAIYLSFYNIQEILIQVNTPITSFLVISKS